MEKIKAIIIEDEQLARELIKNYLADNSTVEIIGEFADGFTGLKAINELKPDLVFLDVQMPKLTGFELLELLDFTPNIIFTTAYNQYAIKAFELNAIDYLLKPFPKGRLNDALKKAIDRIGAQNTDNEIVKRLIQHNDENEDLHRIVVKKRNKIHVISVDDIVYIESQDDYVMIYTRDDKYMKQKTMKFYESNLPDEEFCRIHRSYIVRVNEIDQLELYEKDSYIAILKDKTKLKVSRNGYKNLKQKLSF